MSSTSGGRRGTYAAYAALAACVFALIGVVALVYASAGGAQPPQPPAEVAGNGVLPVTQGPAGSVSRDTAGSASPPAVSDRVAPHRDTGKEAAAQPLAMPPSRPVRLDIDAIDVHTAMLRLGLNRDGSLQVPWKPLLAGWFTHSPTPGQVGPAVIAGHVDSWETGPAVFYRLGSLTHGDAVAITRADGSRATFVVDAVREYPKDHFPTVPVYGNTSRAELRLITCGDWNSADREYDSNVVAFAHLVKYTNRSY